MTALRQLHDDQVIRRSRGCIDLIDRSGLEKQSCECYRVLREGLRLEAQHLELREVAAQIDGELGTNLQRGAN